MKYYHFLLTILFFVACDQNKRHDTNIEKGVSLTLATFRKQQIDSVKYHLFFNIPKHVKDTITSKLILKLSLKDKSEPLVLDFNPNTPPPTHAIVNGKTISIHYQNEHLIIPKTHFLSGNNTIEIDFTAGDASLNRNDNHLFSLLVPDRARTLFPCFDQPNIKANYILHLSVPKNWQVLAGAPIKEKIERNDTVAYTFQPSDKMSTYLFSFVAGEFTVEHTTGTPITSTLYHQEKDSTKIRLSVDEIFNLHKQSIAFLEDYTQYEFPFQKLDFAALFTHPYGGMEHTGAIQYRQSSLFLDHSATLNQKLRRAKLIAHETSHMWFGNLVTMKWFDDVWLKEVFANFMADKIVNPQFPEINHNLAFFLSHYPASYAIDRSRGANPIGQQLDNLNHAGSLYGSIIYHKAPIMMRQLETILGASNFKTCLQNYIATYANDNASWEDLIQILDNKTPLNLKDWSNVWVNSPGRPLITSNVTYNTLNKIERFTLEQHPEFEHKHLWHQVFDITLVYNDRLQTITVNFNTQKQDIQAAIGLEKPNAILYNSNGLGYGVFPINSETLKLIPTFKDDILRATTYVNCHENTLLGNISIHEALDTYLEGIKTEKNELILAMLCGKMRHLFWTYLSEKDRNTMQSAISNLLFARLQSKTTTKNIKKILFGTFKSVAYKGEALEKLYGIWNTSLKISDLSLNADDYTRIAKSLVLYNHTDAPKILSVAKSAITDPNKLKRFNFITPALSNDVKIREDFFKSFKKISNRTNENWVLQACAYIHHPLRQKESIRLVSLSLDLLEDIQQTSSIFFPKSWLSRTIGQYTSVEAYNILNTFLEDNPNLNPKLRLKVLQATHDLSKIQSMNLDLRFSTK